MSVRLFFGVPGTGKTQAMMDFIAAHAKEQLFFVNDSTGDWSFEDNPRWRDYNLPHHTNCIMADGSDFGPDDLPPYGIILFPNYLYEKLDVAILAKAKGNAVFVDDELDTFGVYKGWNENPLKDIIHRGRHLPNAKGEIGEMHLLGACRRPQSLHTDITALADEVMCFRVSGRNTVKRLRDDCIVETDEQETILRTQPNFHFFLWKSTGEVSQGVLSNPFEE